MTNLGKMMKSAQDMQAKMAAMQKDFETIEVEGQAGGGMVTVMMNGKGEMRSVKIDPSLFNGEDAEVVEDLIVAACNDAKAKAEAYSQEEMSKITGGLNLPPGMKMPF